MTIKQFIDRYDIVRWAAALAARGALGIVLAVVLSMVALAIVWGLYIFSGANDRAAFMIVTMGAGGLGAGVGSNIAWIRLDRQRNYGLALTVLLCVAGGVIGGVIGYQIGANREFDCCAEPRTNPFTYTAVGAAVGSNVVMYLVVAFNAAARAYRLNRRAAQG